LYTEITLYVKLWGTNGGRLKATSYGNRLITVVEHENNIICIVTIVE